MHDMHKLALDMTFTQMKSKKGIKNHGYRAVAIMYKEYTPLEYMRVTELLDPDSLTISQKKIALQEINLKLKT